MSAVTVEGTTRPELDAQREAWFARLVEATAIPDEIVCVEVQTPDGLIWMGKREFEANPIRGCYINRDSRKRRV